VTKALAIGLIALSAGLAAQMLSATQAASVTRLVPALVAIRDDLYRESSFFVGDFSIRAENKNCGDEDFYEHLFRHRMGYAPDSQPCSPDSIARRKAMDGDYFYPVKIHNYRISITKIVWDYVFADAEANAEFARQHVLQPK